MVLHFCNVFGNKRFKLSLLLSRFNCHAQSVDAAGLLNEGDIIHLLHTDNSPEGAVRFYVFSIDPLAKKRWGPYSCGACWNDMLESSEASNIVHLHGYRKTVRGDWDLKSEELVPLRNSITRFILGLPFKELEILWDLLNEARIERIKNRVLHPRTERDQKFKDSDVDIPLSRMISKVNACMTEQLFWGRPIDNNHFILLDPQIKAFEQELKEAIAE